MKGASCMALLVLFGGLLAQDSPIGPTKASAQAAHPSTIKKKSTADGPAMAPAPKARQAFRLEAKKGTLGPAANDFWWPENNGGAVHLYGPEGRAILKSTSDLKLVYFADGDLVEGPITISGWAYQNEGAQYWMFFSALPTPNCLYLQKEIFDSWDTSPDNKLFNHYACAD